MGRVSDKCLISQVSTPLIRPGGGSGNGGAVVTACHHRTGLFTDVAFVVLSQSHLLRARTSFRFFILLFFFFFRQCLEKRSCLHDRPDPMRMIRIKGSVWGRERVSGKCGRSVTTSRAKVGTFRVPWRCYFIDTLRLQPPLNSWAAETPHFGQII